MGFPFEHGLRSTLIAMRITTGPWTDADLDTLASAARLLNGGTS